jgi:hypothetical protein
VLGVLAIVSTPAAALGLRKPSTCQRSSLGFTPKTARQTMNCTKHTKKEPLTRAEGRRSRVEGQKNGCRRRATQSHIKATLKPSRDPVLNQPEQTAACRPRLRRFRRRFVRERTCAAQASSCLAREAGSAVKPIRAFFPRAAPRPLFHNRQQPPGSGRYPP